MRLGFNIPRTGIDPHRAICGRERIAAKISLITRRIEMPIQVDWDNLTSEQNQAIVECLRIAARRGRELRLQRERAIAARGDLETGREVLCPHT